MRKRYPVLVGANDYYEPGRGPILMWMHPVVRLPAKAAILLFIAVAAWVLMDVLVLFVIGNLKTVGL